jgi:hypothetical protein
MSTWENYLTGRYNHYMMVAARLEGVIDAHRILKGEDGDTYDRLLWDMTATVLREARDE